MPAIDARQRLLAAGVGAGLLETIVQTVNRLAPHQTPTVVELGCGTGELLGRIGQGEATERIGIDLAVTAIDRAARSFPGATWIVANADRTLPLLDASIDVVLSVHARRNAAECARVAPPGAWLIVAVPAHDDLIELREAVFGQRVERDRTQSVELEHDEHFSIEERFRHGERVAMTGQQQGDLLTGTYRAARHAAAAERATLQSSSVTLASDVLVFRRRS